MVNYLPRLSGRDSGSSGAPMGHSALDLVVVLLVLLVVALLCVGGLLFMRRRRRARMQQVLPVYNEKRLSSASTTSNHRRVAVRPSESIHIYQEKQAFLDESASPPSSPIPEIRVTFPEEFDAQGKRQSGRVVVVRVGETGVGLEPVDDQLPAYQLNDGERFQSLDLERIGGLVEKAHNAPPPS